MYAIFAEILMAFFLRSCLSTIVISAILFGTGCSSSVPDSGFLNETNLLKKEPQVPFDGFWIEPGTELRKYTKVYIAPIDTTHLLKMSWWEGLTVQGTTGPAEEAKVFAKGWQDRLKTAFSAQPGYQVVEAPDAQTLVIEMAIVEVVPAKPFLNAITEVIAGAFDTGSTSMEGRLRIGPNGEIVTRIKDTEIGQFSIISIADLEWYSHGEHTLDHWTTQLTELCSSAPDAVVPSASWFTLRPW